jgi:D-amino-acid dehydrogenase
MKILILGGGIIGVTTAYYLAKAGEDVTVVDRQGGVGLETSFANAGLVSPGHSYTWASPQAPGVLLKSLVCEGQALRLRLIPDWRMYAWGLRFLRNCTAARARHNTSIKLRLSCYSQEQLRMLTSQENLSYEQTNKGLLYLYRNSESLDRGIASSTVLTENGLVLETLDRAATIAKEPALAKSGATLVGSIYCPSDGTGDAHLFTKAVYRCCVRLGVKFEFNRTIVKICGNADLVDCVETSRGRMTADCFVLALGSYSPVLARTLGYRLPVYPVKGYSMTLPIMDQSDAPGIGGVDEDNLIAWARLGNRMRFTATAEFAGYHLQYQPRNFVHMLRAARELFPDCADYSQPTYWAGLRPMTPEGTPFLGKTRHRNLYLNTGHGHLGWTWSCGSARLLTDIIHEHAPAIDLTGLTLSTK